MWFSYRKTALGTAVRDSMAAVIGFYSSREEAEADLKSLSRRLSAKLKVLDLAVDEEYEYIARLDPDAVDIVRGGRYRYTLIALWTAGEP